LLLPKENEMLQSIITEVAGFLLGARNREKTLAEDLFTGDQNIIEITADLPLRREVYVAAFDLDKYTIDLLDNLQESVEGTIGVLEQTHPGKYICFVNGPLFDSDWTPVESIGRRKSEFRTEGVYSPQYLAVSQKVKDNLPACIYTDLDDNVYIEARMADDQTFEDAKMFLESTPLMIDVEGDKNNLINQVSLLKEDDILADDPAVIKGMPFIGISEYNSRRFLVIIMLENVYAIPTYTFETLFGHISAIAQSISVKTLVFTDGSDSQFLKFNNVLYNSDMGGTKDKDMPYFIGVRKKQV
jgi:hypothetical protein